MRTALLCTTLMFVAACDRPQHSPAGVTAEPATKSDEVKSKAAPAATASASDIPALAAVPASDATPQPTTGAAASPRPTSPPPAAAAAPPMAATDAGSSADKLSTDSDGSPSGAGYGRASDNPYARGRIPRVRLETAAVVGKTDKDIVRRIVRAHINELRACYTAGLDRDPAQTGRIGVRFTIGPEGNVESSTSPSATVTDQKTIDCFVASVARWKFPKPDDGAQVIVDYPFFVH